MTAQAEGRAVAETLTAPGPFRLVGLELRRFWWRRLTRVGALLAVAAIALTVYGAWQNTRPPSPTERAQQEQAFQRAEAEYPDMLVSCRAAETQQRASGNSQADFGCARIPRPTRDDFGPPPASFPRLMTQSVEQSGIGAAFILFLIGASFVAAEFRTGSIGTWLTFEPRRVRVAVAKLTASALGGLLVGIVLCGLTALGIWAVSQLNAPASPPAGLQEYSPAWSSARAVILMTAAALGGAVLGTLTRSTAAVIGVLVGYVVVFEGIVAGSWPTWQPWLLQLNVRAWLQDGATYLLSACANQADGYVCTSTQHTLTLGQAAVNLVVLGVVLSAAALVTFVRRDVTT